MPTLTVLKLPILLSALSGQITIALAQPAAPEVRVDFTTPIVAPNYVFACTDPDDISRGLQMGMSKDGEAMRSFVIEKTKTGSCTLFPGGTELFVIGNSSRPFQMKIRKKGDFKELWTLSQMLQQKTGH